MSEPLYTAAVEGDPIAIKGISARSAAREAARHAEAHETITVIGPRGGITYWRPFGPMHEGRFTDARQVHRRCAK